MKKLTAIDTFLTMNKRLHGTTLVIIACHLHIGIDSVEDKTEVDDVAECLRDGQPTTGVFGSLIILCRPS